LRLARLPMLNHRSCEVGKCLLKVNADRDFDWCPRAYLFCKQRSAHGPFTHHFLQKTNGPIRLRTAKPRTANCSPIAMLQYAGRSCG
jgi:hypothetical protein